MNDKLVIEGVIQDNKASLKASAEVDKDGRLTDGKCICNFYINNQLKKGPCEHSLAAKMLFFRNENHS